MHIYNIGIDYHERGGLQIGGFQCWVVGSVGNCHGEVKEAYSWLLAGR